MKSEIDTSTSFCWYCSTNKAKKSAIEVYMGDLSMLISKGITKLLYIMKDLVGKLEVF